MAQGLARAPPLTARTAHRCAQHFSVLLPERLPAFCAPSLSLLARHYVDSADEVQQAARALMEGTLLRMSSDVRAQAG
eukprot:5833083-Prymnesium_polylepis.1